MCDPVSIGTALVVAGAVGGAYSSYQETKAANAAAEYNARINERNAEVTKMQAKDALDRGKAEADQKRVQTALMISKSVAAGGASGAVVNSGSMLDARQDATMYGTLDAMTIRRNAEKEAWGYDQQGANYTMQAGLSRMSKRSPWAAAGMSLLNSGSQIGSAMMTSGAKK